MQYCLEAQDLSGPPRESWRGAGETRRDFKQSSTIEGEQWSISGPTTLVPLIITIALAVITQEVLLALYSGVFWGCFVMYRYSLVAAFKHSFSEFILEAIADADHVYVIVFSWLLAGMVAILQRSGGAHGMAELVGSFAKGRRGGQLAAMFCTLFMFFDDYSNCLISGSTMRPITDKLYISREKLAQIVDSSAAALASLAPISGWIGFELSLIADELKNLESEGADLSKYPQSAYLLFLGTIPTRFYPVGTLFIVLMLSVLMREYGPMLSAQRRAAIDHKVVGDNADPNQVSVDEALEPDADTPRLWWNSIIPIVVTVTTVIVGMLQTGAQAAAQAGLDLNAPNVFGSADAYAALTWGAACGSASAFLVNWVQYKKDGKVVPLGLFKDAAQWITCAPKKTSYGVPILTLRQSLEAWLLGIKNLSAALLVLILAWAVGTTFKTLGSGIYISSALSSGVPAGAIPVLVFAIAAVISFATGTSFGTMSLLFPLAVPAAYKAAPGNADLFKLTISAILAGAVFGDHCTPISDTTILSALATKCDLPAHVITQLPYALTVGFFAAFLGYLPAGFRAFGPPYVALITVCGGILIVVYLIGVPIDGTRQDILTAGCGSWFKPKAVTEQEVVDKMPDNINRLSVQAMGRLSMGITERLKTPDPTWLAAGGYRPSELQTPKEEDPEGRDYVRAPSRQAFNRSASNTTDGNKIPLPGERPQV
eukprot:jgi/Botrbrau1/18937/Bobra.177_2s0083.3